MPDIENDLSAANYSDVNDFSRANIAKFLKRKKRKKEVFLLFKLF